MKALKFIFCFILVAFISNLFGQKKLTSIYSEKNQPEQEYLGIEGDHLYYAKVQPNGYFIMKENLTDNTLESNLIHRIEASLGIFDHFALHNGKILLNNTSILLIYDIETEEQEIIDISEYGYSSELIYSHDKAFLTYTDILVEIDLQNFEIETDNSISKQILDGMLFDPTSLGDYHSFLLNGRNVLLDSFAMSFHKDNSTGSAFYSINLHTKEVTTLESFPPGYTSRNIWLADNGWHYYSDKYVNGKYFFYTFTTTENGILTKKIPMQLPVQFDSDYSIAYLSDTHLIGLYYYEDFMNDVFINYVVIQNLTDNTYQEYTFDPAFSAKFEPDGYYKLNGNVLNFIDYDGNIKSTMNVGSTFSFRNQLGIGFINWYSYTFGNKWLGASFDSEGVETYYLIDKDSYVELGQTEIYNIYKDPVANKSILWAGMQENQYSYHEISNEELITLTNYNDPIKSGGKFEIPENTFDPIMRASNKNRDWFFYNFSTSFNEVDQNEDIQKSAKDLVQVGDFYYHMVSNNLQNYLVRFQKEDNIFERQSINFVDEKPQGYFRLHKGYDFMLLESYSDQKIHMSTLDLEGNLRYLKDINNIEAYSGIDSKNNVISTNGQIYALAKDPNGEHLVPYKVGKDFNNTNVLFNNPDFSNGESIFLLSEGDLFSYIDAGAYFFIKNDGETIFFNEDHSTSPYYYNGKFYFKDKYFDESLETFIEWNSGMNNIHHIQNDIVFGSIDDAITLMDINTFEIETLNIDASDALFYSGEVHSIIYLPQTKEVCWSDATLASSLCNELPENLEIGMNYRVEKDFFIFTGSNKDIGSELFFMDKSGEVTTFDINHGPESSAPLDFIVDEKNLYFTAFKEESGRQIYSINLNDPTSTIEIYPEIKQMEIYPNPSNDLVSAKTEKSIQRIEIINSLGNKIKTIPINNKTDLQNIDISFLSSGVYYFKYFNSDQFVGVSTMMKI